MTTSDEVVTNAVNVSILHKYDYDNPKSEGKVTSLSFQFYISTIMTCTGASSTAPTLFQFYISTIMTQRPQ